RFPARLFHLAFVVFSLRGPPGLPRRLSQPNARPVYVNLASGEGQHAPSQANVTWITRPAAEICFHYLCAYDRTSEIQIYQRSDLRSCDGFGGMPKGGWSGYGPEGIYLIRGSAAIAPSDE